MAKAHPKKNAKLVRRKPAARKSAPQRKEPTGKKGIVSRAKPAKAAKAEAKAEQTGAKRRGRKEIVSMPTQKEAKETLDTLMGDEFALQYLQKNVSRRAGEVLGMLATPRTDEFIAMELDLKINSVRRILNIMQGYGITNYYVAKNVNGWLSFAWYINTNKINSFFDYIKSIKGDGAVIRDDCNDYFLCNSCYKSDKMIFTFDSAYEAGFKCGVCGTKFSMINKEEAQKLVYGPGVGEAVVTEEAVVGAPQGKPTGAGR